MAKKKAGEGTLSVSLSPSVARDLITVLQKFSVHKHGLLQMGEKEQAQRLLELNLFRQEVEERLSGYEKAIKKGRD